MTTYPHQLDVRRPHINYWLVAAIGLTAALVALGAWVVVDQTTGGGGATQDATALIDKSDTAFSTGDPNVIPSLYAKDAVIRSIGAGETYAGVNAIRPLADGSFTVERVTPVTVDGEYATAFMRLSAPGLGSAMAISVFQIKEGKIVRQWNFLPGQTPPFDNAVLP